MIRLLLIEDEAAVREMLRYALADQEFEVVEAADAHRAWSLLKEQRPDLILLDWMLPGMSGIEFARRLRRDERLRGIPIIMLTARAGEDDRVDGLDAGADDYVTKPFSTRELRSRIHAVLRRTGDGPAASRLLTAGDLRLDPVGHTVTAGHVPVKLGPTEFRLLQFFMEHGERVFSRAQLLDQIWGQNVYVEERTVDVHIRRLRKALAPFGCDAYIQTVRTVGYRFSVRERP